MDKDYFLNSSIQKLQFEHTMSTWNPLSTAQELHCSSEQQPLDCFVNLNWDDKSTDQYNNSNNNDHLHHHFDSMVSSPVATISAVSNDSFALRELIGKRGTIGSFNEITPPFHSASSSTSPYILNNSCSSSCLTTPLNSPPKLSMPMVDQIMNENLTNRRNSVHLSPALPAIPVDPGFAARAAKFSCFGSRSFNGRTSQFGLNNTELSIRPNAPLGKLPRVSSSPALKQAGSPLENKISIQPQLEIMSNDGFVSGPDNNLIKLSVPGVNLNEEFSVSDQLSSLETGCKAPDEFSCRKRKSLSRGKAKEDASDQADEAPKDAEAYQNPNAKRSKPTEGNGSENNGEMKEEEAKSNGGDQTQKQEKVNQKPPEPPKDYIHVRARRGQATDSHSLAERVRREKIGQRMKFLQDLVPGCNKVSGKALMLDEIINYVQALQRQVEFLSMKLASVNPRLDFDMENLMSKDMFQPNATLPPPVCSLESSAATFYSHQAQQTPQLLTNTSNVSVSQCPVDPLGITPCSNSGMQLSSVNGFGEGLPQLPAMCEDDLQTIVQMGFNQNQGFPATDQTSCMKVEQPMFYTQ